MSAMVVICSTTLGWILLPGGCDLPGFVLKISHSLTQGIG
jgi:hypothetical protein